MKRSLVTIWCAALWLGMAPAHATQNLDADDAAPIGVNVPRTEISRITFAEGRIKGYRTLAADLEIKAATGDELLVLPRVAKPITLFIVSAASGRTYQLLLTPGDSAIAENIVLREPASALNKAAAVTGDTAEPLQARVLRLIKALAVREPIAGADISHKATEFALWREARFVRLALYTLTDLQGEVFELTNTSPEQMVMAEAEFYAEDVIAVAVGRHVLPPNARTLVYVVRRRAI
ncbi:MAG: type-F conjugative transfer system secretin TraK [Rhodocyclaceae bacterium]|nr:type-F conjugative transfer system secretin TraK [Rhodocyclaceae bacterium]MBX3669850.1 type-F conjugative transfer system secretin TraK [Rhodocyclaceae bacterium]